MPQARKSTSRRSSTFKEPAALKRLNKSLTDAEKALKDLRDHAGRGTASSTQGLYKGLGKFLSDARKDSTKFASAIKKDFEAAAKAAQTAAKQSAGGRKSSTRSSSSRSTSSSRSRSTGSATKRTTSSASRSTSSRSGASKSGASRSTRKSS